MSGAPLVAGIELGGTKIIAVAARDREIVARDQTPTGAPEASLAWANRWLRSCKAEHGRIEAIGIASFGPLDLRAGQIGRTPKPGWSGTPVVATITAGFDCPIGFDTDVAGAALAEGEWGAARGCDVYCYLTIGTGIGGGLVIDGRPVHGLMHPEMGHLRVRRNPTDRFPGICPFHGDCIEGLASGPAIAARAGRPPDQLPADDPLWHCISSELAELIAALLLIAAPQRIMIGGGVGQSCVFLLPMIRTFCAAILNGYGAAAGPVSLDHIIVSPALGSDAGPLGSVALALAGIRHMPR